VLVATVAAGQQAEVVLGLTHLLLLCELIVYALVHKVFAEVLGMIHFLVLHAFFLVV